jgi:putative CocE/NonD family hydrolase
VHFSSRYLTMRDGVRIAINVFVPIGSTSSVRLPTILHQTRYYRSMELRLPARIFTAGRPFEHIPPIAHCRKRFVANDYAWVDVDVRGSGASFGGRACEWSPDEIRDSAEIVDWIVRQPWSDGKVGALGISYDGAAAEFVLLNRHPAVRAIAPRFSLFDAYTDIAFPGGIHAEWFTRTWGRYNHALDRNAPHEVAGWWVKLLVTGVQPVQDDHDRSLRAGAIAAHRDNYDVHEQALALTFRDDVAPSDPYHHKSANEFQLAGTPVDASGSIAQLLARHRGVGCAGIQLQRLVRRCLRAFGDQAVPDGLDRRQPVDSRPVEPRRPLVRRPRPRTRQIEFRPQR